MNVKSIATFLLSPFRIFSKQEPKSTHIVLGIDDALGAGYPSQDNWKVDGSNHLIHEINRVRKENPDSDVFVCNVGVFPSLNKINGDFYSTDRDGEKNIVYKNGKNIN